MDVAGSKGPGRTLPSDGSALAGVEAAGGHDIDEAVYLGERVLILSSSPTVVREQLRVGLPRDRDQLHTRVTPRFAELRTHVYEQIQAAKRGAPADRLVKDSRPDGPSAD